MNYGLKYKAGFTSDSGSEWSFCIYKKDYSGAVFSRPLGAAPILKCDDGDKIKGTSLEFVLESIIDGELEEFYTTDNKMFRVEILRGDKLFWSGFLLPELYSESYIAPPYDVHLSATDGIGILKDVGFDMPVGKFTLAEVIDFCCRKTGLQLSYLYASSLKETRQTGGLVYSSISIDTKTFEGCTCYEVLEKLLASTDAYITQLEGGWFIGRYGDLSGPLMKYNPATKAVTKTSVSHVQMGAADNSDIYPIGELGMEIVPAKKSVKFLTGFGAYPSMLTNYDFSKGLTNWEYQTGSENAPPVSVYTHEGESQVVLLPNGTAYQTGNNYSPGYIQQSIRVERTGVSISLSFQAAMAASRDKLEVQGQKICIRVHLLGDNGANYYLTREGWRTVESEIEISLALTEFNYFKELGWGSSGLWNKNLEEIKIVTDGFPATGTLSLRIRNASVILITAVGQLVGGALFLKNVSLAAYVESRVELQVPLCQTASASGDDIDVPIVDAPVGENIGGAFYNTMWLGNFPTEKWISTGLQQSSFLDIAIKSVCSRIGVSRRMLSGTVSGIFPGVALIIDKFSSRKFFFQSYEYNLLENEISCSLMEFVPAREIDLSNTVIENGRSDGENGRTSGDGDYRVYQVTGGVVLQNVKMIRDLDNVDGLTENYFIEVDSGFSERSAKASLKQIGDVLLGNWFYEKDGLLYCKLDFVGEKSVAAYGQGTEGGGGVGVDLIDNLLSTRQDAALTANMGRYLLSLIDSKASDWASIKGKPTKLSQFINDTGFITNYTNNYLNNVVGGGNSVVTFLRQGMQAITWNAAHAHNWADITDRPASLPANGGNSLSVGDGMLNIYPYINEINFGGTQQSTSIHFGYSPKDGRTIPTDYYFGNGNGSATVRAANFILAGKQVATTDQIPASLPANGGTSDIANCLSVIDRRATANIPHMYNQQAGMFFQNLGMPTSDWWSGIHVNGWERVYHSWELVGPSSTGNGNNHLYYRDGVSTNWNNWKQLAFTSDIPTSLPANGGNADTVDNYHAADINTAGWNAFTGYIYDGINGVQYYWSKIAAIQNDGFAIVEIYSQGDSNYASGVHAVIYMSCYNGGASKSVTISTETTLGTINLWIRLDSSGNVWLKSMSVWSSHISVRNIKNTGSATIYPSPQKQLDIPINSSNEIEANGGITVRNGVFSYTNSHILLSGDITGSWFKSRGAYGWFNETYGGGIHMTDNNWIRTYNGKSFRIEHSNLPVGAGGWNIGLALSNPAHTGIEMKGGNFVYGFGAHSSGGMYWWRGNNASLDSTGNKSYILFFNGTTFEFTGNITASGEITAYSASDERLKNNVRELDGLSYIEKLRPVEFDWTDRARQLSGDNRQHDSGLIAQELRSVLPEFVANIYNSEYLGVNYNKFIPILIAAVKQLAGELQTLKNGR